jgi:hypothetical protein
MGRRLRELDAFVREAIANRLADVREVAREGSALMGALGVAQYLVRVSGILATRQHGSGDLRELRNVRDLEASPRQVFQPLRFWKTDADGELVPLGIGKAPRATRREVPSIRQTRQAAQLPQRPPEKPDTRPAFGRDGLARQ